MLKIYGIYDKKAESFTSAPFFNTSHASAIRMMADFMRTNPDTVTAMHPDDFTLFSLGEFDQEDGILLSSPLELCTLDTLTAPASFSARPTEGRALDPSLKVVEYSEV